MSLLCDILHISEKDRLKNKLHADLNNIRRPEDIEEMSIELDMNLEEDAQKRYENESDPYRKRLMKRYMDKGYYDFDEIFGRE